MVFFLQGCVIHSHSSYPDNRYKTKGYTVKNFSRQGKTYSRNNNNPQGYTVKVPPPRQNSSNIQKPPPQARAHVVAKGKPFANNAENPSHTAKPPQHARAHEVAKRKPFTKEDHPSSNGNSLKARFSKSAKKSNHPSLKKYGIHEHNKDQEKPLWENDSSQEHAGTNKTFSNGRSRGTPIKGTDSLGKGKAKGRGNPRDANEKSSDQDDIIEQTLYSPNEKIQLAKAKSIQSKDNTKKTSTETKSKKNKKQKDKTVPASPKEAISTKAPSQPVATTASFTPLVFDSDQRTIIQSYFAKPGKGKGKQNKKPKGRPFSLKNKNDILTQSAAPLPKKLKSKLPPPPPNTRRVLFSRQVLLIERNTNRVLDVINLNN